jgi:sec-independent protein translocase protein TatC
MWMLFELGIIFSRMALNRKRPDAGEAPDTPPGGAGPKGKGPAPAATPTAFMPLTEEEMDAELDAMEAHEDDYDDHDHRELSSEAIEANIRLANELRQNGNEEKARELLYDVLQHGDEKQVEVAMNILHQIDDTYH